MSNGRIGPELRANIAAQWFDILGEIAAGGIIGKILPARNLTRDNLRVYLATTPEARKQWDDAREASADAFLDQIQDIANSPGSDPKRARVQLQALQWLAAKRNPRAYSDKQQIDMNIKTVDLTAIIQAANARLAASRMPAVIEGERVPDLLPVHCSIAELM